jgi:hypothetical protein
MYIKLDNSKTKISKTNIQSSSIKSAITKVATRMFYQTKNYALF